jgi:hypothetical protein
MNISIVSCPGEKVKGTEEWRKTAPVMFRGTIVMATLLFQADPYLSG